MALACVLTARALTTASDRAQDSTGPVLVATQELFASIAEADAASAAVFLSGVDEDREQRRLYELALERSSAQVQEVSRLVDEDDTETHDALKAISTDIVTYSGLVESARVANAEGLLRGPDDLTAAIELVQTGIVPEVEIVTARTQGQLQEDADTGTNAIAISAVLALVCLAILVAGQVLLARRTNRILNLPLVVATALVVATLVVLLTSWSRQQDALDAAQRDGYDSIALTAEIQTTAFRYKTLESLALIAEADPAEQAELAIQLSAVPLDDPQLIEDARNGSAVGDGLLLQANRAADTTRELAATAEMLTRWDRYLTTSEGIQIALRSAGIGAAAEAAVGPGNADFNGFNTSVESVLLDNQTQFSDGLAQARSHLDWLLLLMVALPAAAVLFAFWGYQIRIREYRR